MKAVILAAGVGRRFGARTARLPKCMIPIGGTTLLERYFDAFRRGGVREAVVVVGHLSDKVRRHCRRVARGVRVTFVKNRDYRKGSVLSLRAASRFLEGGAVIMDADVYFPDSALRRLLRARRSAFLFDPRSKSGGEEMMVMAKGGRPWTVAKKVDRSLRVLGEATGIFRLDAADAALLREILDGLHARGLHGVEYEEAYSELARRIRLGTVPVGSAFWSEMDFEEDWARISAHIFKTRPDSAAKKARTRPKRRFPPRSKASASRA